MDKLQKQEFVESVKLSLKNSRSIIIAHYHGLTVDEITKLRVSMRKVDTNFKIVKNSLLKIAIIGTEYESLTNLLVGPTAIAYSSDSLAAAKSVVEYAKTNDKIKIIGGVVESQLVDEAAIKVLSSLPSLDELRGKIIGALNAPASKIVGVISAPASQIARVLGAYATKN